MASAGAGTYTDSDSFLFEGCAGLKEKVETLIPQMLQQQGINNKVDYVNIKSGGLFGFKNRCIVIRGDKTFEVVVSCIPIGNYLNVSMYLNMKSGLMALVAGKATEDDVFAQQQKSGMYSAIKACCQKAFNAAGISL